MEKIHLYRVKSEKETAKPIKTELEKREKKKKNRARIPPQNSREKIPLRRDSQGFQILCKNQG